MSVAAPIPLQDRAPATDPTPWTHDHDRAPARAHLNILIHAHELASAQEHVHIIDTREHRNDARGVIPGSLHLPLSGLVFDDTSASAIEQLATSVRRTLQHIGITANEHLVFVDDSDGSASLGYVLAQLAGCSASVLVGGMQSWVSAGFALDTQHSVGTPVDVWATEPAAPGIGMVAPFEHVRDAHATATALVDTRSQLEHEGIIGGVGAPKGNIPTSLHLEWSSLFGLTGDIAPAERIRTMMDAIGVAPEDAFVLYCNAAHRAAAAALILRNAGYTRAVVYLGGWHEWTRRDMPVFPRDDHDA